MRRQGGFVVLALLMSIMQSRHVWLFLEQDYVLSADAARGVVSGLPHWRVFQGRVLSPFLVHWLSWLTPTYLDAHVLYGFLALTLAGYLSLQLAHRLHGDLASSLATFLGVHALFSLLLLRPWLYVWDYVDLVVFIVFVYLVMAQRGWIWHTGLFAVAIFNRESALFIALWMIVDPALRVWSVTRRDTTLRSADRRLFAAGIVCLGSGALLVEGWRSLLLVREVAPELYGHRPRGHAFHLRLPDNINAIRSLFPGFDASLFWGGGHVLIPLFLLAVVVLLTALARRDPTRYLSLAVVHLALIAAILTFGVVLEARVYIDLIPIVAFGLVTLART